MIKCNILDLFSSKEHFIVPFFQRDYIFQKSKINNLLNDIRSSNYAYIDDLLFYHQLDNFNIVDGQQRLVTYYLICCAVASKYYQLGEYDKYNDIIRSFIIKYDLFKLRIQDRYVLEKLVYNIIESGFQYSHINSDSDIIKAYTYIFKHLDHEKRSFKGSHYNLDVICRNLHKVKCSYLLVDKKDCYTYFCQKNRNALISKNNSSVLIKNYILDNINPEDYYDFKNKWSELEDLPIIYTKIKSNDYKIKRFLDRFIRQYLTIKLDYIPEYNNVYDEFINYFESSGMSIKDCYTDIYKYSKYYRILFLNSDCYDEELNDAFSHITEACFSKRLDDNIFNDKKYYSYEEMQVFLLKVYLDYKRSLLSKKDLISITSLIESYIIRRDLCDITSDKLAQTFLKLYNNIDKNNYLNSFIYHITKLNKNKEFPDDDKLRGVLLEHDFYKEQDINKYILSSIENSYNGFDSDFNDCEIEHILPRRITDDWKFDLGTEWKSIHEQYTDTLGNLTLLEKTFNRSIGNKSFPEKTKSKEGGYTSSRITMTRYINKWDKWNLESIKSRTYLLTEKIIELWPYPKEYDDKLETSNTQNIDKLTIEINETYPLEYYNLDKYENLFNKLSEKVIQIDKNIIQNNNKYYIAFKINNRNIANIYPNEDYLDVKIKLPPEYIDLSKITNITYNDLDEKTIELYLEKDEQIPMIIDLMTKSFEYITLGKIPPKTQKYPLEHYGLIKGSTSREIFDEITKSIPIDKNLIQNNTANYITYKHKKSNIITIYNKEEYLHIEIKTDNNKISKKLKENIETTQKEDKLILFIEKLDEIKYAKKIIKEALKDY